MPEATVNKVGVASEFKLFHPNLLFFQGLEYLDIKSKGIILFFFFTKMSFCSHMGSLRVVWFPPSWVMDMCTAVHGAMSLGGVFPPHIWRSRDRLKSDRDKTLVLISISTSKAIATKKMDSAAL